MTPDQEKYLVEKYTAAGYTIYENTERTLGFVYVEDDEHHWCRDYDKEKNRFFAYNAKQRINLITTKKSDG